MLLTNYLPRISGQIFFFHVSTKNMTMSVTLTRQYICTQQTATNLKKEKQETNIVFLTELVIVLKDQI